MTVVERVGRDYRLGSRVPLAIRSIANESTRIPRDAPSKVVERSSSTTTSSCSSKENSNLCEKPGVSSGLTLPIVLGVVIPLVVISCVLLYLHRRNVKRVAQEDSMDPHKSLDFGLVLDSTKQAAPKTKRKSTFFGGEKDMFNPKHRQLSMDMNLSSPYLLPPEMQNSRESLHSLARTLHQNEDPYRPIHSQYGGSDAASMRSLGSAVPPPYAADKPIGLGSMPTSPAAVKQSPFSNAHVEFGGDEKPRILTPVEADSNAVAAVAELQAPEPVASKTSWKNVPVVSVEEPAELPNHRATTGTVEEPFIYDSPNKGIKGLRHDSSTYSGFDLKLDTAPVRQSQNEPLSSSLPKLTLGGSFNDDETFLPGQATSSNAPTLPHVVLPEERKELYPEDPSDDNESRGRGMHRRQSSEYPPDNAAGARQSVLGLPQGNNKRLSVGFRPLPPSEVIESEDPETRANRIRSFYKEYFEDSKPDMAEYNQHYPPQGVPKEWRGKGATGTGGAQYYEDYDQSYQNGEANAYFDPQSNTFVMPYAQPVQRRAMTPPPSGSRFPGGGRPRGSSGGQRNVYSSMGSPMGPRAGSAMSQGMRPDSSASQRYPGSRSASNMSGRINAPKKVLPPPEPLSTLPTPSKLRDDSIALLGAIDFAPPPTIRDHAAGRSQSPIGDRRPYQMKPTGTPIVSSFEEMAPLPSPYMMRKSATFTGLDFAPPRKFKDPENSSDAGSIRSNRSGVSAMGQAAIRSGAGRVSRLPGDQIFTPGALADTLKPDWGMRQ